MCVEIYMSLEGGAFIFELDVCLGVLSFVCERKVCEY